MPFLAPLKSDLMPKKHWVLHISTKKTVDINNQQFVLGPSIKDSEGEGGYKMAFWGDF